MSTELITGAEGSSYASVNMDHAVAVGTAMLHILHGVHTEWDTAAEPAPSNGEASTDKPGQQASRVICLGDHRLPAVGTHGLTWGVPQRWSHHNSGHCSDLRRSSWSSRVLWGRGIHTTLIGAGLEPRLGGRACGWVVARLGVHPWLGAWSHPSVVHGGSRVGGRCFTGWISFLHPDMGIAEAFFGKRLARSCDCLVL